MSNSSSGLIYEAVPKVIADVGAVGKTRSTGSRDSNTDQWMMFLMP